MVGDTHFERVPTGAIALGFAKHRLEHQSSNAESTMRLVDSDVHHVPGIGVTRHDQVPGQ